MRRVNTIDKNPAPIRTPIVRFNGTKPSDNKMIGSDTIQETPQLMSYSLSLNNNKEDLAFETNDNKTWPTNNRYLSIPKVRVQTPVQCLRSRSLSVPSIESSILMEYSSIVAPINNRVNEDLITLSSRHLSFYSPSESSHSFSLHSNKYSEDPKKAAPVQSNGRGQHSGRESTKNENSILERSKRMWSTMDNNSIKSNRDLSQYSQRPDTPFEAKGVRRSSIMSLKDVKDSTEEEIELNNESNGKFSSEKQSEYENSYLKFSKSFPFIKRIN